MLCSDDALRTPHMIHMRDHVDLDAAQLHGSAPAGVEGLRGGGGRTRIRLTATYSLSGTNQSTDKAQDGTLVSRHQFIRLVAPAARHSPHRMRTWRALRGTLRTIVRTCADRVGSPYQKELQSYRLLILGTS